VRENDGRLGATILGAGVAGGLVDADEEGHPVVGDDGQLLVVGPR
jgi:uracil-DNA glycosylase